MIGFLTLAAAAVPLQPITLHCEIFDEGERIADSLPNENGWDARIRFTPSGKSFKLALIDGPPLFSSSQGLMSYSASPTRSGNVGISSSQSKVGAWKVKRFNAEGMLLLRGGTRIEMSQTTGVPGAFSGNWHMSEVMDGHVFLDGGGLIACRTLEIDAPTAWDNYRP